MTPTSDPRQLAVEAAELNQQVQRLSARLSVSHRQVQRMRWLTALTAALAVLAVVGGVVSIHLWNGLRDAARDTHAVQVQNCRNGNESRAANYKLWAFVLNQSAAARPPEQREQIERIRAWVALLYAPRDCSNLAKKYPLPDPPKITLRDRR